MSVFCGLESEERNSPSKRCFLNLSFLEYLLTFPQWGFDHHQQKEESALDTGNWAVCKGMRGISSFRSSCPGNIHQLNWPELEVWWDTSLRVIQSKKQDHLHLVHHCRRLLPTLDAARHPVEIAGRGQVNPHCKDGTSKGMPERGQVVTGLGILPLSDNLHATSQNPIPQNSAHSFLRPDLILTWSSSEALTYSSFPPRLGLAVISS